MVHEQRAGNFLRFGFSHRAGQSKKRGRQKNFAKNFSTFKAQYALSTTMIPTGTNVNKCKDLKKVTKNA